MALGAPELLIILVIVIVLFGVGRIGKIGSDLGTGIREFRKGLQSDEPSDTKTDSK
jgi:sec-independent protein translocase protein TatA